MLEEKAKKLQKRKQLADEKRENDKVRKSLFLSCQCFLTFYLDCALRMREKRQRLGFKIIFKKLEKYLCQNKRQKKRGRNCYIDFLLFPCSKNIKSSKSSKTFVKFAN